MAQIFTGFLLIFLDFNLNLNQITIGLIPDFLGFYFLVKGLDLLRGESSHFSRIRPFAVGMSVYTAVLYALDLLGVSVNLGLLSLLLGLVSTIIALYISHTIVCGVEEMQQRYETDLNGVRLRSAWKAMAIFQIVTFVSMLLHPAVTLIAIVISVIATICFLVAVHQSKIRFEHLPNQPTASKSQGAMRLGFLFMPAYPEIPARTGLKFPARLPF